MAGKPARNPTIGEVACAHCGTASPVRQTVAEKGSKLYYNCPKCGPKFGSTETFQNWMLENATIWGPGEDRRPSPPPEPEPEPARDDPPPAPPPRRGLGKGLEDL